MLNPAYMETANPGDSLSWLHPLPSNQRLLKRKEVAR